MIIRRYIIYGRVKFYRKSHDQIGRYRMGLGEKTASRGYIWEKFPDSTYSSADHFQSA